MWSRFAPLYLLLAARLQFRSVRAPPCSLPADGTIILGKGLVSHQEPKKFPCFSPQPPELQPASPLRGGYWDFMKQISGRGIPTVCWGGGGGAEAETGSKEGGEEPSSSCKAHLLFCILIGRPRRFLRLNRLRSSALDVDLEVTLLILTGCTVAEPRSSRAGPHLFVLIVCPCGS